MSIRLSMPCITTALKALPSSPVAPPCWLGPPPPPPPPLPRAELIGVSGPRPRNGEGGGVVEEDQIEERKRYETFVIIYVTIIYYLFIIII